MKDSLRIEWRSRWVMAALQIEGCGWRIALCIESFDRDCPRADTDSIGRSVNVYGLTYVVAPCHQINDSTAAVTAPPSILSGDIVQDLCGWVLRTVPDMGGCLADRAGPRVAHDTTPNLVLDVLRRDKLAALRDVAVRAVGRLHLHHAGLKLGEELRSEEEPILLGGDGLAATARREQRLVRQRQREELLQTAAAVLVAAGGASDIVEGDIVAASAAPTCGDRTSGGIAWSRVVVVDVVLLISINLIVAHVDGAHFLKQILVNPVVVVIESCALDHHGKGRSGGATRLQGHSPVLRGLLLLGDGVLDELSIGADGVGDTLSHVTVGHGLEIVLVNSQGIGKVVKATFKEFALRVRGHFVQVFELQLDDKTSRLLVKVDVGIHSRMVWHVCSNEN